MMLLPQGGSRKLGVDPSTGRVRPATAAWTPCVVNADLRRCVAARAPNEPSPRRRSVARVGLTVHVPPLPRVGNLRSRYPLAAVGYFFVQRATIRTTEPDAFERSVDMIRKLRDQGDKKSGSTVDRPGLAAVLRYARSGDVIVVHTLDRL